MNQELEHRKFLNKYYQYTRHIYDFSRKYYLFGRDQAIQELLLTPWESLLEIGPGTGRNLRKLRRKRKHAVYGGLEASDEMLLSARASCPWAKLKQGFAETSDLVSVLGIRPEVILFSYSLSMMENPQLAIQNAMNSLAPQGQLVLVDFSDLNDFPVWIRKPFKKFLNLFHVSSINEKYLSFSPVRLTWGPGRYFVIARLRKV